MSDTELEIVDVADADFDDDDIDEDDNVVKKGRGKDIYLDEYATFEGPDQFKQSDVYKELKEFMTRRKNWKTSEARKEMYVCKFSQKRGYQVCRRQYLVAYNNRCMEILVFHTPDEIHVHKEDPDYFTKENYHWTSAQEAIVIQAIKNKVKKSLILRQLKEEGACNGSGKYPDIRQVGVKKRYMKNVKQREESIVNVHDLRVFCERNSISPDDENTFFVPYYYRGRGDRGACNYCYFYHTQPDLNAQ